MAGTKRKGGSAIEEAMQEQRIDILAAVEEEFDNPQWILISFFDAEATVDVRDKDGKYLRFRWRANDNKVAEERAMQGLRVRRITYADPD